MSGEAGTRRVAAEAADALRGELRGDWELFGEDLVHHEIHLIGQRVEMLRGPIGLRGVGLRLFEGRRPGELGVGQAMTNDLRPVALAKAVRSARAGSKLSAFPATGVTLPGRSPSGATEGLVDPRIRDQPLEALEEQVQALLGPFGAHDGVQPSFGSFRVTYGTVSVRNSAGAEAAYPFTRVDAEVALKSSGGPEGRPPGEYWWNAAGRRLDLAGLGWDAPRFRRLAEDVRRAEATPAGEMSVIFPAAVLGDILPPILGFQCSGGAERRKMGLELGRSVGPGHLEILDDPTLPWAVGSSPFDDEGTPSTRRAVIRGGQVASHFMDALNGAALGKPMTGHARRTAQFGENWYRWGEAVSAGVSNLSVPPGPGGSDADLIEAAGDGIWLEQLGYAFPDAISGAFGGEVRIGYRIRGGKLAEPIRGGTIGGTLAAAPGEPSLLSGVRTIGSRVELAGRLATPAWLVDRTSVAGPS